METILPTKAPDSLTDTVDAGFAGLELNVAGPDPGEDPIWTPANRTCIRERAVDLGVDIPSMCLGFLNRGGLTSDNADVRADARVAIRRAIDASAALGAEAILVPFFGDAMIESEREQDRLVEGISTLAGAAEATGVDLAIENSLSGEQNARILDRIDSPAVGCYYDVGNAIAYGNDPVADLRALGSRMIRLHVKDYDADGARMIGEGEVDFPGCVEAVRDIGYDGWVVLETVSCGDPIEDAATNLERVRSLFA